MLKPATSNQSAFYRRIIQRRQLLACGVTGGLALPFVSRAQSGGQTVLRVGDQKGGLQALAGAAGVLGGLPYRLEWNQFIAAAPVFEALNADAVDTGYAADAPTTFALAAGLRGHVVAANRSDGGGTSIIVGPDSPIRDLAGLKGKTIGTNRGSIGHALVLAIIESQGWRPNDIRVANLLPADAKIALSTGAVDAWSSWGVYVAQAKLRDRARVLVDGTNGLLTGLTFQTATDRAIADKRALLTDFINRLARARRWARDNPDAYAAVLASEIGVNTDVAEETYLADVQLPVPIDATVITGEQRTIDRYVAGRLLHDRFEAVRVFDRSFNDAIKA